MSKEPYYVDMEISTEKLASVPKDMNPADLFISVAINAIIAVGKKKGGLRLSEHSQLYKIRNDLQGYITTGEAKKARLEEDDFRFLMKCWNEHTPDPQANELVMRVDAKLREAQSRHDRNENNESDN